MLHVERQRAQRSTETTELKTAYREQRTQYKEQISSSLTQWIEIEGPNTEYTDPSSESLA